MKIFRKFLSIAVAATVLGGPATAQEVTLRFQHFISPKGAIPAHFGAPWAEKIEAESDGRIKVEIYPAMQLGGTPPMVYDQIRDNVIDGGWAIPGYNPGRFPGTEVFELPFISSNNAEVTSKAVYDFYEKYLQDDFADIKLIAIHVHGPGAFHTKDVQIDSVDDFAGLKLRAPTRVASLTLEALGATPVGMPVPQLPESISKGVVDGGVIPFEIVAPLKIHELATSHTVVGGDRALYNTVFIWGMNKGVYDGLPDDLKAVIDANSGAMAAAWAGRAMDTGDIPGKKLTEESGNPIITLSDEEVAKMVEMTQPVIDAWIAEMTELGLPAAEMVEDARALVAKYDQ
ncbi:MAG: TRAP transporter substrate-binding protein [Boseongicola sp.]|nr:TRAP transporter substrate-binding protein [Boseongicola sp.]